MLSISTLLIVPTVLVPIANQFAATLPYATEADALTFKVPLFAADADDDETPTHCWVSVALNDEQRAIVTAALGQFPGSVVRNYELDTNPNYPFDVLDELNLRTAKSII